MKKIVAVCVLVSCLVAVYFFFQPTTSNLVGSGKDGKCLPVSIQELNEGKLSNLQCVDVEGWEVNILVLHVQTFITRYPRYRVTEASSYGTAAETGRAVRRALCPDCPFHELHGDARILVRLEKIGEDPKPLTSTDSIVEKAAERGRKWRSIKARAEKFHLTCASYLKKECENIIALAEKNRAVAVAIKRTARKLTVWADNKEDVSFMSVYIKDGTSEDKIIALLNRAFEQRRTYDENENVAYRLGIYCSIVHSKPCAAAVALVNANPSVVKDLIAKARSREVSVYASNEFKSGIGWVSIDGNASAERIAEFLRSSK